MAQILVRDLDKEVVKRLKRLAKADGRSLQWEAKTILTEAAFAPRISHEDAIKGILRIRKLLKGRQFPDSVELIREDRDR
jgi:antitoxin FitA